MKIKLLTQVAILLLPLLTAAQKADSKRLLSTETHLSIGVAHQNYTSINIEMTSLGIPTLGQYSTAFGYGGSVLINKLILGGQGTILINKTMYSNEFGIEALSGTGGVYAGFLLFKKHGVMCYPTAGIDYGAEQFQITSKTGNDILLGAQTFGSSLTSMSQKGVLTCQLNYDTYYKASSGPGLMVGFAIGYHYKFNQASISLADENGLTFREIANTKPGTFLASLKIGFGTFHIESVSK